MILKIEIFTWSEEKLKCIFFAIPNSKSSLAYLKGVERTVFGVWTACLCGVTPAKSLSWRGVLRPPFKGVSTFVRAIRFWASWTAKTQREHNCSHNNNSTTIAPKASDNKIQVKVGEQHAASSSPRPSQTPSVVVFLVWKLFFFSEVSLEIINTYPRKSHNAILRKEPNVVQA